MSKRDREKWETPEQRLRREGRKFWLKGGRWNGIYVRHFPDRDGTWPDLNFGGEVYRFVDLTEGKARMPALWHVDLLATAGENQADDLHVV